MKLRCPHCDTQIDSDSAEVRAPSKEGAASSMMAYQCPGCEKVSDFMDWKAITANAPAQR